MSLVPSHDLAGRYTGGMLEYVVAFRAEFFSKQVWPAIEQAFAHQRFDGLEALTASAAEKPGSDELISAFVIDLRTWRAGCRQDGRYYGPEPFCGQGGPECRRRSLRGEPMCGMRDCYRRLTEVVLRLCRPAVEIKDLLADAGLDAASLCDLLVWSVAEEEPAVRLWGSPLNEFPPELNRSSLSVYLTHFASESQVARAARAFAGLRDRLVQDLPTLKDQLAGLEAFWQVAADRNTGLALCYAEP